MRDHMEIIREEFTRQAAQFSAYQATDDKTRFSLEAIRQMGLTGREAVLEVAAGTCAFGRMIAPHAVRVTELDATEAMLRTGQAESERAGVTNADYILGTAEALPFAPETFDAVVSRLAFHHFAAPEAAFAEMHRVLKPGGQLVVADMAARPEPCREIADHYERLRDPSHVRCLTAGELTALAEKHGMTATHASVTTIPMRLSAWMALTKCPAPVQQEIRGAMEAELSGGAKTGFAPCMRQGEIGFDHQWLLLIFKK